MKKKKKRDLLTIFDLERDEVLFLVQRAAQLKKDIKAGKTSETLRGKSVALVFEKASTRTRVSFEVGVSQLGGQPIFISARDTQMGRGEPVKDTARTLSSYVDMIMLRTHDQKILEELAAHASVPVINGLSDLCHPCQVLSDILTVSEHKIRGNWMMNGKILLAGLEKLSFAWIGDGNNMANSWIAASGVLGLELKLACPGGFHPDFRFLEKARSLGGRVRLCESPQEAASGADVVSTDVWASMGQEEEAEERRRAFAGYTVNQAIMKKTARASIFMHCLPAHRGEEVSEDVFEGGRSVVWEQAANRLHMQKAIMEFLIQQ